MNNFTDVIKQMINNKTENANDIKNKNAKENFININNETDNTTSNKSLTVPNNAANKNNVANVDNLNTKINSTVPNKATNENNVTNVDNTVNNDNLADYVNTDTADYDYYIDMEDNIANNFITNNKNNWKNTSKENDIKKSRYRKNTEAYIYTVINP